MKATLILLAIAAFTLGATHNDATTTNEPAYEVIASVYKVQKSRDPFAAKVHVSPSSKQVAGTPMVFRLDGILYQANDPSASVNGTLVRLNKPVTIRTDTGEAKVKAVEITRDKVVLEVNDQKVELKINMSK
jgi:hypothetical protein